VLFADSFKTEGSDTIYYTNRIVRTFNNRYGQFNDTAEKNLPQFLHTTIRRSINGVYAFYDDTSVDFYRRDTFVIQTLANAGDSWLYDTAANITATVQLVYPLTQFGVSDSGKQISLSNGAQIILSKSFGLLFFTADTLEGDSTKALQFLLQGIETRRLGDSVINFWNIYNFSVGDEFYSVETPSGPSPYVTNYIERKFTVINKDIYDDSISYTMSAVIYSYYYAYQEFGGSPPSIGAWIDTVVITYQDSDNDLSNKFPGQYMNYLYDLGFADTFGVSSASYVPDTTFRVPCKAEFNSFSFDSDNLLYNRGGQVNSYYCIICAGLGVTHSEVGFFETGDQFDIEAYTHNGITYGIMPTDSELLSVNAVAVIANTLPTIQLYPNLVRDNTNVFVSAIANASGLLFSLFDLTGRQVLSKPLNATHTTIDCHLLSAALYVWRVTDAQQNVVQTGKLVKE
jgi:hypothetical protein